MEKIKVWGVYAGASEHHAGYPKWFFEDKTKAKNTAYGRGYYSCDAKVEEFDAFILGSNIYICTEIIPEESLNIGPDEIEEIRESAMEKIMSTLTDKERKVLGL